MMKFKTYYLCQVNFYSQEVFLSSCFQHDIQIIDFKNIDNFQYEFIISKRDFKKLSKNYLDLKIIKIFGFESYIKSLLINKIAIISIIISMLFYFFLN